MINFNLFKLLVIAALAVSTMTITTTTSLVYAQQITTSPAAPQNMTTTTTTTTNATNATAAAANATTNATGGIVTALIWNPGDAPDPSGLGGERVEQLSPENIQYQQSDPGFLKLAQTTADCLNHFNEMSDKTEADAEGYIGGGDPNSTYAEDIQRQDLCTDVITQGINQFCESTDFATFDIQKCEEARTMSEGYVYVAETLYG